MTLRIRILKCKDFALEFEIKNLEFKDKYATLKNS